MTINSESPRPEGTPAGGETDLPKQPADRSGEKGSSIGERVGHNPANLGDDVADSGDLTHPTPDPGRPQL